MSPLTRRYKLLFCRLLEPITEADADAIDYELDELMNQMTPEEQRECDRWSWTKATENVRTYEHTE